MAIGKERNYPCSRRQKSWCMSWLQPTTRGLAVRCRAAGTQIGCGALWLVHGFAALHGGAAGLPADGKAAHCHGENVHHMTLSAPPPQTQPCIRTSLQQEGWQPAPSGK